MYRLLEMAPEDFEPIPAPLLTAEPMLPKMRSPGDDSKEFCYSCGIDLNPKTAKWQVLRFMFERPSQRRQSSSGEGRPHICTSCAVLAFASPLKVTDQSIIVRIAAAHNDSRSQFQLKEYLSMLASKEMHMAAGRYILLASDKTQNGDLAAQKLGQVQYALAKVASLFPLEVLSNFHFSLICQSSQPIPLENRHLVFISGLLDSYGQSIILSGKEVNMKLGDAIRYVQQDLPYLANYTIAKIANIYDSFALENVYSLYWEPLKQYLPNGESMKSNIALSKRAKLYRDVAALTGLTFAFAHSLENTAKKSMKPSDVEREVSKLIEKVDDATAFAYYATLGVQDKVKARLWCNADNYFIYEQTVRLLSELGQTNREETDESEKKSLQLYADDLNKAYAYFANQQDYAQEKDWKELTYQLKLSLYTRFPELVRKIKTQGGK